MCSKIKDNAHGMFNAIRETHSICEKDCIYYDYSAARWLFIAYQAVIFSSKLLLQVYGIIW